MRRFRDRLEGGYRVVRIRKLKHMMYLLFGVLILIVGILMMILNGVTLDPFFLPLDMFLLVTLYFLIVVTGLNFFFRNLEIRHNTRNSQKHLMARNSQRTGIAIIGICAFVAIIVIFPATASSANEILSLEGRDAVTLAGDRFVRHFENQDRLGLFKSEWIDVRTISGQTTVQLCEKADFAIDDFCDNPYFEVPLNADQQRRIQVPEEGYVELALIITNRPGGPSTFSYHVERNPASIFIGLQPLLICMAFIVFNSAWTVYLHPIKRRYATTSVYSEDYIAPTVAETELWTGADTKRAPAPEAVRFGPTRPKIRRREVAAPPMHDEDALPPPPLPGTAHPLPKGAFLNEIMVIMDSEGDKKSTIGFLRSLIGMDPVNKDALCHLGDVYQQEGNYQFAFNEYDRITKIDPKDDRAWVKRGEALIPLERELEAIGSFKQALELSGENPAATEWLRSIKRENQKLMARAIDCSTNKDFTGAIELYDKILRRDPENAQALLGKGTMYRRLEKWPASLEALNKVLEIDPKNVAAMRNKVEVFESVMSWEEALDCYDEMIERAPDNYLDWVRRGDVLFELGRTEDAIESYREAEKLKPDSDRVQKRMKLLTAPEMDETVKMFTNIPGIGKSKAIALFEAGYESVDDLKKTGVKKLAKVKGISKGLAKKIKQYLKD
ncbi:MAG: tetratricopeptide repeat protein [Thermoplasmata archaeon]